MPSPFSHVRTSWNRARYTEAQATELRHLRALYTTHCAPAFGPDLPDAFALQIEGNDYLPRYTARTIKAPLAVVLPPAAQPVGPYAAFADGMERLVDTFEAHRRERWYGKGHPNDPLRLLGLFLRNSGNTWLRSAVPGENTLARVTALRQYVEALAQQSVFREEAVTVLLHNLASSLSRLEKENVRVIRLHSAREHFRNLQDGIEATLHHAADFLFHALADKDRTVLPFSLTNLRAEVVHKKLSQALATREGLLLQHWALSSPEITQLAPLLEENGEVSALWQALLGATPSKEGHANSTLTSLPRGIASHVSPETVEAALQLHGLCALLSQYQSYTTSLWELAGFGGDHCVYDQLQEAVSSILTELRLFNQSFASRCSALQQQLDGHYKKALAASTSAGWQANYRTAKIAQEKCLVTLQRTDAALVQLLANAQDIHAQEQRSRLALEAHSTLMAAPRFLNRARVCLGLPPQAHYPGLESLPDPFAAALPVATLPLQQTLTVLLPRDPSRRAWLQRLCPAAKPWSLFRGAAARYRYIHQNARLSHLGQHLAYCTEHTASPSTPEKRAFIASTRNALQEEQARLIEMRKTLTWPFHRTSIRFFATLQEGIVERLQSLEQQEERELATLPLEVEERSAESWEAQPVLRRAARSQILLQEIMLNTPLPVSSENRARLEAIHTQYCALEAQERAPFDAWQRTALGGPLWSDSGLLRSGLTQQEAVQVSSEWAKCLVAHGKTVLAKQEDLHAQVQALLHRSKQPSAAAAAYSL